MTIDNTEKTDPRAFYGDSYKRAKNPAKLDSAVQRLDMALRATSDGVLNRALDLACKAENEAFE